MADVYDQFDKATARLDAYAVMSGAAYVGRIVFAYPSDGAGRLWCYAQAWGATMVRGYAGGYGYDKRSAAAQAAVAKLLPGTGDRPDTIEHVGRWRAALADQPASGEGWQRRLEDAGYTVLSLL